MKWLLAALRTRLGQAAALALAVLAALGLARAEWRSQGRTEAEQEAEDADRGRADEIRRNARNADGVQPGDDTRGFRDGDGDV